MLFSAYTLGCKLNQLETEAITDAFSRGAFTLVPLDAKPDLVVINTCTVTSMAEQKARRLIRKILREQSQAFIIVTGCYAQLNKEEIAALGEKSNGRLFIVPGEKKDRILDLPAFLATPCQLAPGENPSALGRALELALEAAGSENNADNLAAVAGVDRSFRFAPETFSSHSRAFLKIQDGCDRRCTYCRVSLARGKSRSLGAKEVLGQLKTLESRGFTEAVLTGVNISQYRDLEFSDKPLGLPQLLDFLLKETSRIRLRLSSIEPDLLAGNNANTIGEDFFQVLTNERIRPHFHLSLQSGSAGILARMARPYTPEDVERGIKNLRLVRNDPFLACDIIAGFPGETDAEFEKTLEFCRKNSFAWIHAFPFSPRPGTAASSFPDKVSEREAVIRVKTLTELALEGRRQYIHRWLGKEVEAVAEAGTTQDSIPAVSENYLKLLINCTEEPPPPPGSILRCRLLCAQTGRFDALAEITELRG